jgi:hypothetical protein
MSSTSYINPTAITDALPTMPSNGRGGNGNNADYIFNRTGFDQYVMSFLTPDEVEKQKRFDEFQSEQKRLMAKQQKIREQEKKLQDDARIKAHLSGTCGRSNTCTICQHNEINQSLNSMWKSRFDPFTGT